jgi:hypothetical protein
VADVPTGRYRSFDKRGWPMGYLHDEPVAALYCKDEYVPRKVQAEDHGPIKICVAQHFAPGTPERKEHGGFRWLTLKRRARSLLEAKQLAHEILSDHPEWWSAIQE